MHNPSRESTRPPLRGTTLPSLRNHFLAAALAASVAFLAESPASAATITQSVNSTSDSTIHWMGPIWGSPADYPSAGNDYVSDGSVTSTLRTGSAASGITFSGDSLTLRNGVNFIVKRNASANYIAESGAIFQAGASGKAVNGTILVASGQPTIFTSGTNSFTFNALISGSGTISVQGSGSGETIIANPDNTFSGDWIVESGTLVGLVDGALGDGSANLAIASGGLFALDTGYDHAFAAVTLDGTALASGTYGWNDLTAAQQAFFLQGSDTLTVLSVQQSGQILQSVNSTSDSTIHWMGPIWGSPADYPAAGNDYVSDGSVTSTLRTGSAASGITFSGDSLTLRNGVSFIVKRNANANYIAESGAIFQAGANDKAVNGTILVASGQSTIFTSGTNSFTFNALVSGAGTITVQGSGSGETVIANPDNTFSGDWTVESGTLVALVDGALGDDSTLSLTGSGLFALDTGFDHAFSAVTIDGTALASGTYGWSDFSAGQQAYFLNGSDLLIVGGAAAPDPVTYYQVSNQNGSGNWDTLADWNTVSDGSGTAPAAINATDHFIAQHTAWQLRSSGTFGGGSLTLGSNHYLRVGGSGAVQTVPNLITRDTPSLRGGNSLSTLVVDNLRVESDTLELRGYSSTAPTFNITLGTVTGTGDLLTNGPVAGHNRLTILDATSFQGDLNVQTGGTEFLNDLSSGGSLIVATPSDLTLDHDVIFTGLTVGATTYSPGTYSASALGFAGSGSVTVRPPATWYLTTSQTAGDDWTASNVTDWTANANGSGGSAPSINIVDTYVHNVGTNILRTPSSSSTFLGGTLRLGGSARLQLLGSASAISTAPVLATTGGVINAGAGTRNLAADTLTAESGNATLQTASGGVLNLFAYDFKGAGNLTVSGAGQFRPRIDHGNGYTGTITVASGATLSVQSRFGIAGALVVSTGGNVILDDNAYVTGLTVAGVAKPAGNYTAASLGWSGAGTISVYARDVDGPPQMFGVNFAGAEFTGFAFWQTNAAMWDYYLGKGLTLVRMPVKWEVIQPNLYGTVTFTQMDQLVALANARGMKIIWDLHNYNQRKIGGTPYQVGAPELPYSALADLWTKIADRYKDEPCTYGYDLMNEPHGTVDNWAAAAQVCVDTMRQVDRKNYIIVEGMSYASSASWVRDSGTLDIKDPVGRLIYSAHSYWDYLSNLYASPAYFGSDGNYQSGDVVRDLNDGVEHATPFVEWLKTRPYAHGNFGEYAIPDNVDSANWNIALGNFLAYLRANNISGTYWAAGNNWSPSPTVCQPQPFPGTDRLQMAVLELYHN